MVNHGRPSTACLACRQRRLKCDRLPVGCSQCRRKGIQCAGYRDPSALRVKDETARISCKFEKKTFVSKASASPHQVPAFEAEPSSAEMETGTTKALTTPYCRLNEWDGGSVVVDVGIMAPLRNNLHDLSMAYFLTSYIHATPFEAYLPAFFLDSPSTGDACSMAIEATALAAYSRRVRSCSHLKQSRERYAKALRQANELLSRPGTAVVDRTLVCVLVLGLFEAIVFEGGRSPASWTTHTDGSMQLLLLRGPQQFESSLSRTISSHASNNIKTSCIQRSIPVPDGFLDFDRQIRRLQNAGEPSIMLSPIIHEIASIKAKALSDFDCNLVHDALRVDRQILLLAKTAPDWMSYEIRPESESPSWAYKRVCHHYTDVRAAKVWNAIRLFQLFLVIFIKEVVSPEDGSAEEYLYKLRIPDPSKSLSQFVSELRDYAVRTMDMITTDLLATIPIFMEGGPDGRRFAPAARSLAWPLSIIEWSDLSPKAAQDFAFRQLVRLAGDLNMPGAVHPSRFKDSSDDW
ncbi:hypothetical protein E4U21_001521 [Claviceps maximensis]|nr:hypothetical protein E4U21_001521 [Claviceps maximensis]